MFHFKLLSWLWDNFLLWLITSITASQRQRQVLSHCTDLCLSPWDCWAVQALLSLTISMSLKPLAFKLSINNEFHCLSLLWFVIELSVPLPWTVCSSYGADTWGEIPSVTFCTYTCGQWMKCMNLTEVCTEISLKNSALGKTTQDHLEAHVPCSWWSVWGKAVTPASYRQLRGCLR